MIKRIRHLLTSSAALLLFTALGAHGAVSITTPPQASTKLAGDLAVFTVQATGTGTLTYQWKKDGTDIDGATQQGLVLNPVAAGDAATYSVVVSDADPSSATSSGAVLTVRAAVTGDVDFGFAGGASVNGNINAVAVQADGKVIIGGSFTTVGGAVRGRIARLNADGTTDHWFGQGMVGANDTVYAVAVQSDGKVVLGGNFTTVNGTTQNYIARLNSDGTLDTSFGNGLAGVGSTVLAVGVQSDGKVVIGGSFTSVNGTTRNRIARLNSDGTLDTAFGNGLGGASNTVNAAAVQSDGKVVLGGDFSVVHGTVRGKIARLNSDGTLDTGFGNGLGGANLTVNAVAVQSDGKMVIGGSFSTVNGTARGRIARLNSDGTLDTDFGNGLSGPNGTVLAVAVQSDGQLVIGGTFNSVNDVVRVGYARLLGGITTVAPTVSAPTSTSVTITTATLGGNVTSDGGASITARGVVYSKTSENANPEIGGTDVTNVTTSGTTGVFTVPVSGLSQGTSYTFKAYATNSEGTSYTSVGTFTTAIPVAFANGDFEINGGNDTASAAGWTFSPAHATVLSNQGTAGSYGVGFGSGNMPADTVLSQAFLTTPGQTYAVSFDYGGGGPAGMGIEVKVVDGGSPAGTTDLMVYGSGELNAGPSGVTMITNTTTISLRDYDDVHVNGQPAPNARFAVVSFVFTAQSSVSTIVFTDQSNATDGVDTYLDNVVINAATASTTPMIQPDAVSTSYTTLDGAISRTINQSGLTMGYVEGVTDFATYIAAAPTHGGQTANVWYGTGSSGTVTFDVGTATRIGAMALWLAGPESISQFALLASNDAGFTTSTTLGTFNVSVTGTEGERPPLTFSFAPVTARYFRLNVLSQTSANTISIGEVAFKQALPNTGPIAPDGTTTGTTGDEQTVALSSLVTPSDVDGDTLTLTNVTAVTGLVVSFSGNNVTFTPGESFTGNASFTYTVSDGTETATGTITVTVTDNDAPTLQAPAGGFAPLVLLIMSPLPDYAAQVVSYDAVGSITVVQTPAAGTTYIGGPLAVTLVATDTAGNPSTVLTINVSQANRAPVANDDVVTFSGASTTFNPLLNDNDPDNDTLTIIDVGDPSTGSVTFTGSSITYTKDGATFDDQDGFTYTVSDGKGGEDTAAVIVASYNGLAGTYTGLLDDGTGHADGIFRATVTVSGNLTGRAVLNGRVFGLSGRMDSTGADSLVSAGVTFDVQMQMAGTVPGETRQHLSVVAVDTGVTFAGNAIIHAYSSPSPVSALGVGYYHTAQIAQSGQTGLPASPGWMRMLVAKSGAVTVSGRGPDTLPVSCATAIVVGGQVIVYANGLQSNPKTEHAGVLNLTLGGAVTGVMKFHKLPQATAKGALHGTGFAGNYDTVGGKYVKPAAGTRVLTTNGAGQVQATMTGAGHASPTTKTLTLSVAHAFTPLPSAPLNLLRINASGQLTGTVKSPTNTNMAITGLAVPGLSGTADVQAIGCYLYAKDAYEGGEIRVIAAP